MVNRDQVNDQQGRTGPDRFQLSNRTLLSGSTQILGEWCIVSSLGKNEQQSMSTERDDKTAHNKSAQAKTQKNYNLSGIQPKFLKNL